MDRMKFETADGALRNMEKIAELFPQVVTEVRGEDGALKRAVKWDVLKELLSGEFVEGGERYEFTWPGKREAIAEAAKPIRKTLRPCKAESKAWDSTENLYIEGDNLEVLKLLQESYLGKVKMIYIDPPYNTGKDFVYRDNFRQSREEYEDELDLTDEDENRLFQNTETNGRFHSDWCSMIYPRLVLANNLLREDGVIFISIDDNEVVNLREICNEIFGGSNFIAQMVWEGAYKNDARQIGVNHEYVLVYSKTQLDSISWKVKKSDGGAVIKEAERLLKLYGDDYKSASRDMAGWFRANKANSVFAHRRFHLIDENGAYKEDDPTAPGGRRFTLKNPQTGHTIPLREGRGWRFDQETFNSWVAKGKISFVTPTSIMVRTYFSETDTVTPQSVFYQAARSASERLEKIFHAKVFDFPKDETIVQQFLEMATSKDSIVLDFFSGSATTAHAVMQLNAEDGGKRKFIMVQLPEACEEDSEAFKAGFKNICEIGKERIRRAGEKVAAEWAAKRKTKAEETPLFENNLCQSAKSADDSLDTGFRVFTLADTNMKDVYYSADEYSQDMLDTLVSNIKEDRSDLDLLYGCLLEWGVELSLPHTSEQLDGVTVHTVNGGDLIACFDANVPEPVIREIAKRKPLRAVFRDASFSSSPEKINVEEIFKLLSPTTTVKVI